MKNGYIILTDAHGTPCIFDQYSFYEQLKNGGFTIFGMGVYEIAELRRAYLMSNGTEPATPESIRKAFQI